MAEIGYTAPADVPSKKPFLSFVIDEDLLEEVDDYRFSRRCPSRAAAVHALLRKALEAQSVRETATVVLEGELAEATDHSYATLLLNDRKLNTELKVTLGEPRETPGDGARTFGRVRITIERLPDE